MKGIGEFGNRLLVNKYRYQRPVRLFKSRPTIVQGPFTASSAGLLGGSHVETDHIDAGKAQAFKYSSVIGANQTDVVALIAALS